MFHIARFAVATAKLTHFTAPPLPKKPAGFSGTPLSWRTRFGGLLRFLCVLAAKATYLLDGYLIFKLRRGRYFVPQ